VSTAEHVSATGFDLTRPSPGLRRRRLTQKALAGVAILASAAAVGILALIVGSVVVNGFSALSTDFFTKPRPLFGEQGGIADAIVGSMLIVGMATIMAVPLGIFVAIFLQEIASKSVRSVMQVILDVLNGVPAIVVGIFVYGLIVVGHGQSAIAGAFSLAILMIPLIARSTQEVLALVPASLREASFGIGMTKARTVLSIVLPTALGGILTGTVLAIARVAGETAPLLFTSSIAANKVSTDVHSALPTIPVTIFIDSEQPDPALHAQAWAASLVLIGFVLLTSIAAKLLAARSRRKLGMTR